MRMTFWRAGQTAVLLVALALSSASLAAAATNPHARLTWSGPATCLKCHQEEARDMHGSVHYQWKGEAPDMLEGPAIQGKLAGGLNSYCINPLGNWNGCGACHVGRGALPEETATPAQLQNIDCLLCHQKEYKRKKVNGVYVPDTASMRITMNQAVRTVHKPVRENCLQCHAKAGGGDAVKRGDLALAHTATGDRAFDVHMAQTGANLVCQSCHRFDNHRVAGKGSDLRATDSSVPVECSSCHGSQAGGHGNETIGAHLSRVACQTCHIPVYAKNAADTPATEATETHRSWRGTESTAPPLHPASVKANNLVPQYRFWNGTSRNALLFDVTQADPVTGRIPTSRPEGNVNDPQSKLYPFKYKTAEQPILTGTRQLIALDTSVFFATADPDQAIRQGLVNMGFSGGEPWEWTVTDTFQLLNHEVSPKSNALGCNDCHGSGRMDWKGLGYGLKGPQNQVCFQCHGAKERKPFKTIHDKHVKDKKYDCSWCHSFSRPERNLRRP